MDGYTSFVMDSFINLQAQPKVAWTGSEDDEAELDGALQP